MRPYSERLHHLLIIPECYSGNHLGESRAYNRLRQGSVQVPVLGFRVPGVVNGLGLMMSESSIGKCDSDWATARVAEASQARWVIKQLELQRIEFLVETDAGKLRILVRRHQLDDALFWLNKPAKVKRKPPGQGLDRKDANLLLVSLPLGILAGSIASTMLGISPAISTAVSSIGGLVFAALAAATVAGRRISWRQRPPRI